MKRYARLLCLFALLTFLPTTLAAAPREPENRFERFVRLVKHFILKIDTRITIPIGIEDPPPDEPTDAPTP